jgi:hypothetical protein
MDRGLIVGALGFAAGFGAERLISSLGKDLKHYDTMRKMSGQGPFFKEILGTLGSLAGERASGIDGAGGLLSGLTNDVVRYARMKGM